MVDTDILIELAFNYSDALFAMEKDFREGKLRDYEFAAGVYEIAGKLRQAAEGHPGR